MAGLYFSLDLFNVSNWAGIADQALYPFFMNHTDVIWPDNARDGQPIKQAHDLWWLQLLCNEPADSQSCRASVAFQ